MAETDSTRQRAFRANGSHAGALSLVAALSSLAFCACAQSEPVEASALDPQMRPAEDGAAGGGLPSFPDTGINARTLTVTGIVPSSGPFAGGNQAVVRGSGFTADALVFIDGNMVQPADTVLRDRNSLAVIIPAGRIGAADVRVEVGDEHAEKPGAYTYTPLLLEPESGSIAGGTSVLLTLGRGEFEDGVRVEFDGARCSELRVVTPHQVRCKTPAGSVGSADVRVSFPEQPEREVLLARRAFEYLDLTDTDQGGLSGGPIDGSLNLTVVDSMRGFAVPGAFVLVGDDPAGPYQGRTDERGQITFSGDDLDGPLTVHVFAECMERASIVAFDAQNVTIHITPLLDLECGMPGELGGRPGRGAAGSVISGELIFPGSDEFAVNGWDVVPPPRDDEVRVAYVFTTRSSRDNRNPPPNVAGTNARVLEETSPTGVRGYPYSIFARPAGLAVYALSGLERRDTGEFTPYVMGVARDVLTAPGDETMGVDIHMDIPLDRELQVALANLPDATPRGPDQFGVQVHVDLGGEGVIVREVNGGLIDLLTSYTDGSLFRFFAQPAFTGSLRDARYQLVAGWYSSIQGNLQPFTELRKVGIAQAAEPLRIDDLLAIPVATAPLVGARVPSDRVLRWEMPGEPPDLYVVTIIGGDDLPAWTQLVPGTRSETPIPDLSTIEGIEDIAPGVIVWSVRAIRMEDFEYDEFKYDQLGSRFWSHTSVDTFSMQR